LRLTEGIPPQLFLQRTGLPISHVQSQLHAAEDTGLLEWNITTLKPTEKGQRYLNDLLQLFM
jgi:coproporphyrinogen III oxidase-like Fe-S oxidoreductase